MPILLQLPKSVKVILGMGVLLLSILIGYFDWKSGSDFSFSLFYIIPPSIAAWFLARNYTIFVSVFNIIIWQWVDIVSNRIPQSLPENIWNLASRLVILVLVGLLLHSLRNALEREKVLSSKDDLTNVLNARSFGNRLDDELARAIRYSRPLTLAFLDVDDFKLVNDTYGHKVGDQVLQEMADVMSQSIRKNDAIGRLGGDEFSIILIETGLAEARSIITSLQKTINDVIKANNWPISISIGVISCVMMYCDSDRLIHFADQIMYSVKEDSKGSVKYASLVNVNSDTIYWEEENHV